MENATIREKLVSAVSHILGVNRIAPAPPVDYVQALEDGPGRIYLWTVREGTDPAEIDYLAEQLIRAQHQYNLQAVHILAPHIRDVRQLTRTEIQQHLVPLVQEAID